MSLRVLELTTHIIGMCEGHYTVWQYRRLVLAATGADLNAELSFIRQYTVERPKNYQLWHHRMAIVRNLIDAKDVRIFETEMEDLELAFIEEPKNYHAWQYRQWLVAYVRDFSKEDFFSTSLLEKDPYNNSAWNHRAWLAARVGMDWSRESGLIAAHIGKEYEGYGNLSLLNYIHFVVTQSDRLLHEIIYSRMKEFPNVQSEYERLFTTAK